MKIKYIQLLLGLLFIILVDNIYLQLNQAMYEPIMDSSQKVNIPCAILSWVVIVVGIQLLVLSRPDLNEDNVFMYGAFLGFSMYGLYNMTNFALYPNKWTVPIALMDTIWGTLLSGITAFLMYKYF